jgi:hypothetical protein
MKKKQLIALLVVLLLGILTFWMVNRNQKSTLKVELSDFAVKDTLSIDKIFLADKDSHQVLLEKQKDGSWMVNKKYPARMDAIHTLLYTMHQVQVKAPVGRASFNTIIRRMAAKSTKCEIYQNGKLSKTYYVGGTTQDFMGTYMMIENSSTPFITWIPGFEGYLYTRYFSFPDQWRSTEMIRLKPQEIQSVEHIMHKFPEKSWTITNNNNVIRLMDAQGTDVKGIDTATAREYLARFTRINFEAIVRDFKEKDSLLALQPSAVFVVKSVSGKEIRIETWPKRTPADLVFDQGEPMIYDPDRFFGVMNGQKKELLLLQYHVFDPILKPVEYFVKGQQYVVKK